MRILFFLAIFAATGFGVIKYIEIARTLPDVNTLRMRASQFETTRILDRNGNILYEIVDPNAGKRTYVPLNRISPYLIAATIATEDRSITTIPALIWSLSGGRFIPTIRLAKSFLGFNDHAAAGQNAVADRQTV